MVWIGMHSKCSGQGPPRASGGSTTKEQQELMLRCKGGMGGCRGRRPWVQMLAAKSYMESSGTQGEASG
jgi:hypothetical protein